MGPTCAETSLINIPEERGAQLKRGGSLTYYLFCIREVLWSNFEWDAVVSTFVPIAGTVRWSEHESLFPRSFQFMWMVRSLNSWQRC